MSKSIVPDEHGNLLVKGINQPMKRATFLKVAGATFATSALVLAGCKDDDEEPAPVELTNDDFGILNYAYALEQLEAAFYVQVIATPYANMSASEKTLLTEIRDHEVIHKQFFKAALGAKAIRDLEVDFSTVKFNERASVLGTAKLLEDTGVAAYNGAGILFKDGGFLLVAGKIVSVEARHASAIRDLLNPLSADFSGDDVVLAPNGFDGAALPSVILPAVVATGFLKTKIVSNLP
ncbi:MAG: ferritin-like domain-containing protein [Ferruginibacter sp.]|nr:ferritin-like domain-containing protein [Cytophagales bacterium]